MFLPIPRFLWPLSGWRIEILSGLATTALAVGLHACGAAIVAHHFQTPSPAVALLEAMALSLIYERYFDAHGFEWEDVGQRATGIALGVALLAVLSHCTA